MGKKTTTVFINETLIKLAKSRGVNISNLTNEALNAKLQPISYRNTLKELIHKHQQEIEELEKKLVETSKTEDQNKEVSTEIEKEFISINLNPDHIAPVKYWCDKIGCRNFDELKEKQEELKKRYV